MGPERREALWESIMSFPKNTTTSLETKGYHISSKNQSTTIDDSTTQKYSILTSSIAVKKETTLEMNDKCLPVVLMTQRNRPRKAHILSTVPELGPWWYRTTESRANARTCVRTPPLCTPEQKSHLILSMQCGHLTTKYELVSGFKTTINFKFLIPTSVTCLEDKWREERNSST